MGMDLVLLVADLLLLPVFFVFLSLGTSSPLSLSLLSVVDREMKKKDKVRGFGSDSLDC